jgi:hypothetical protein
MGVIGGAILYFIFCIIVGSAASNRGRFGFGYFILSLIISPLITFIIVLALGENDNIRRKRIYEEAEIRESVALKYQGRNRNGTCAWSGISFSGESKRLLSGTRWELYDSDDSHAIIELLESGTVIIYHMDGSIYTDRCKNSTWERQGYQFKMTTSNGFAFFEGLLTTKDGMQSILGSGRNNNGDSWTFTMSPRFVFKNITPESVVLISDKTEEENTLQQNEIQYSEIQNPTNISLTDELSRLADLYSKELITLEEYNIAKKKLLE